MKTYFCFTAQQQPSREHFEGVVGPLWFPVNIFVVFRYSFSTSFFPSCLLIMPKGDINSFTWAQWADCFRYSWLLEKMMNNREKQPALMFMFIFQFKMKIIPSENTPHSLNSHQPPQFQSAQRFGTIGSWDTQKNEDPEKRNFKDRRPNERAKTESCCCWGFGYGHKRILFSN